MVLKQEDIERVIEIVQEAGRAVMEVYAKEDHGETIKLDGSALTEADLASHKIITEGLKRYFSNLLIVSEEGDADENMRAVQEKDMYWLVDPLDGTKEFLKRNGEFTICVALMYKGFPDFGVVLIPAKNEIYYGGHTYGTFVLYEGVASIVKPKSKDQTSIVFGDKEHINDETASYIDTNWGEYQRKWLGSALKFIELACGRADVFPRLNHTMKTWDVAAGHALLQGVGGEITKPDGSSLIYNDPKLLIGDFIARSPASRLNSTLKL